MPLVYPKQLDMITRGALGHRFVLVWMYHGIERLSLAEVASPDN